MPWRNYGKGIKVSEFFDRRFGLRILTGMIVFIFISAGLLGCAQEPSLSEAAYAFKKEIKENVRKLSPLFIEPVANRDIETIDATLKKLFSDAAKEGRPLTFAIGILDKEGITLTCRYPEIPCDWSTVLDYSDYSVVVRVLKERKIVQGRFFLQRGGRLYAICAPLIRENRIQGVLALWFSAPYMKETLGVSEEEFLAIDFNE